MPEAVVAPVSDLAARLRAGGVRVGVGEVLAAHRALAAVDPASRWDAYYALRAVLCAAHRDFEVFDAAFADTFGAPYGDAGIPPELMEAARMVLPRTGVPAASPPPPELARAETVPVAAAWSEVELLLAKDFADYTDRERAAARRLLARLARRGPRRLSRRTRATRRRAEVADVRATIRASLRHGGELVERRYRAPTFRQRPVVLVCDVSGSMAPYARMLLQYLQASVAARRRVEAFAFGTRLTRITRELAGRDPDAALERATSAVVDMRGGTRIGDAVAELNREHGRRVGRGAAVIVLSDGWDRGDPEVLAREMARLRRTAHSLVWLNPLAADPRYEPLTRGMRAALPSVDHLLAGNSIASLEALAALLEDAT
ncbi:MAG TPA: VWA domain-containing protein [Solirubrobacteraceae bacterium]